MALNRRKVLLGGAALGAVAAAGASGAAWRVWDQPAGAGFVVISKDEAEFLRALAGAVFPPTDILAVDGEPAELDSFVDVLFRWSPELPRKLMRVLLHALDSWPLPGRRRYFTSMNLEDRQVVVDGWMSHSRAEVRLALASLIAFLGMGFTTHEENVGYFAAMHQCGFGR